MPLKRKNSSLTCPEPTVTKPRVRKRNVRSPKKMNTRSKTRSTVTVPNSTAYSLIQSRPQVISLDVTYSSESENSDVEIIDVSTTKSRRHSSPQKGKQTQSKTSANSLWPSPNIKGGRCTVASDSDDEIEHISSPKSNQNKSTISNDAFLSDSDSGEDLYSVNFKKKRMNTYQMIEDECKHKLKEIQECPSKQPSTQNCVPRGNGDVLENKENTEIDLCQSSAVGDCTADDSFNLNIDNIDVSAIVLKGSAGKPRRSAKTKNAIASLKAFSKRYQDDIKLVDKSLNDGDDDVLITDDSTSDTLIKVRWGTQYIRHTINKSSKFSTLYQEIADKHKVSVSQVVLSFKDNVIPLESTLQSIGFSIGDIIEGGILNETSVKRFSSSDSKVESSSDEDSINLKVQTANHRMFHVLQINKYDKMNILMDKYSSLRNIPLDKLRFKFDGETLQPSETPSSLDLEGDECIDVFEL